MGRRCGRGRRGREPRCAVGAPLFAALLQASRRVCCTQQAGMLLGGGEGRRMGYGGPTALLPSGRPVLDRRCAAAGAAGGWILFEP